MNDRQRRLLAEMDRHMPSPEAMAAMDESMRVRFQACETVGEHQYRHKFGNVHVCHRCGLMRPTV